MKDPVTHMNIGGAFTLCGRKINTCTWMTFEIITCIAHYMYSKIKKTYEYLPRKVTCKNCRKIMNNLMKD